MAMDIYEIRRQNLKRLLKQRFGGKQVRLASAIDRQPGYVSRCLSDGAHRKRIGEDLARNIESSLDLQSGWLDQEQQRPGDLMGSLPRAGDLVREGEMAAYPKAPPKDDFEWAEPEIVENEGPLRPDEVELPYYREVEMAAGDGRTQVVENHGASMRFSLAKLSRAGVQPHLAACATASGTSMEPTILDGSPIGIDKGARHVVDGKIYALDHGGMLRIKRLYKLPLGRVRLVSDNADEYPEEVCGLMGPDAPKIIGRVFWWENFD